MTPEKFKEYVASFNPDYVTKQTAKDLIKEARKDESNQSKNAKFEEKS